MSQSSSARTWAGSFVLPYGDGRETGLHNGPILGASLKFIPGFLSGAVRPDGTGSTPVIPFPNSPLLPPGTTLHCVAVGFDPYSGIDLGAITDSVEAKVQ